MLILDNNTYRMYENLAKTLYPNWRIQAIFNLDVFQHTGFPIRINSNQEIRTIIDTMQEERFDPIMEEMGGLTEKEKEALLDALTDNTLLQMSMFPQNPPLPPFEAMLHALLVTSRLERLRPDYTTLLEIGPGCGYNSHYIKNRNNLKNYSVIEACESFYILQNYVAQHCFGTKFCQTVPIGTDYTPVSPKKNIGVSDISFTAVDDHRCGIPAPEKTVFHYPWWQLGALEKENTKFDVVMSNSNLMEFTKGALYYYLNLIYDKLEDDGCFLVIGSGYYKNTEQLNELHSLLHQRGFAPLLVLQGTADNYSQEAVSGYIRDTDTLVIAPFSEKVKKLLYGYNESLFAGKKLIIVDDFVASDPDFSNCTFMSGDEFARSGIKGKAIIGTYTESLFQKFKNLMAECGVTSLNIDEIVSEKIHFCMNNYVLIKDTHPLYKNYCDEKLLRRSYFVSSDKNTLDAFFHKDNEARTKYSKAQIKAELEKRFAKNV